MTLSQLAHYFRDAAVPTWRKALVLFAAAYVVLPFDAVPDVLPVVGWLDDVGVLAAVAAFLVRDVSRHALRASGQVVEGELV